LYRKVDYFAIQSTGIQAKEAGMSAVTATRTSAGGTPRDLAVTALILGIAAMMWFGWGQAQPPSGWALALNIGTFAAIAVAAGAGSIVARFRRGATAMADPGVRRGYGITVGVEVAACGLGAAGLALAGHSAYIAPWILLVVGVHFVPLGRLFGSVDLVWAGFALSAVAIAGAVTGVVSGVAPSAVTGAFGGLVCIACAAVCLRRALRRGRGPSAARSWAG
jgi:hypothetical protein